MPVPAQLPSPGLFANRRNELADLAGLAESSRRLGTPALVVLTGAGGVGKTTLGLRWLHQIRGEYAAGQLFVDLRGFSDEDPLDASVPLERFLRSLGVSGENIPVAPDEQAALFRSLTTDRSLIVMLDNAATAAQVRPLLPGPGPALVVVTTRRRLSGLVLEGARFYDVDPLDEPSAVELLDRVVGAGRVQAEPEHAATLVRLCGRLPLAVCTSAARLAARRRWPIERVVRELADETRRLTALSTEGDVSLMAVFDISYAALDDDGARRLYRLLGLYPGADFGVAAAAALAGLPQDAAGRLLDALVGANLLDEHADERFHFHDLVRLHARDKAAEAEPEAEHRAAVERLATWFVDTAVAADRAVLPGRWRLGPRYATPGPAAFEDRAAALSWLELELPNLMAMLKEIHRRGFPGLAWQLCEALWALFLLRKHYRDWVESHLIGLTDARRCGDPTAQARMLEALGFAHLNLKDFSTAAGYCTEALELERAAGHSIGEASALEYLGIAELATGRHDQALNLFTQARLIHQRLGRPRGVALMTRHLGEAHDAAGRHDEAGAHFAEALAYFDQAGEKYHQARTLSGLARSLLRVGRDTEAAEALHRSLAAAGEAGARHEEANAHVMLAELAAGRGRPEEERGHLRAALAIYAELDAPQAEEVRRQLEAPSPHPPPKHPDPHAVGNEEEFTKQQGAPSPTPLPKHPDPHALDNEKEVRRQQAPSPEPPAETP